MKKWGLLFIAALTLTACNKGKAIIEEAQELKNDGDLEGALNKLGGVSDAAPETPEVNEAADLAATWLTEAASNADDSKGERELLGRALVWKPTSGPAQVRLCELDADERKLAALKTCLDKLAATEGAPAERAKSIKARASRLELAASQSPDDWLKLVQTSPKSDEAKAVTSKLLRHYSLCHDIEDFAGFTEGSLEKLMKLEQTMKAAFRLSKSGDLNSMGRALDSMKSVHRHATENLAGTEKRRRQLLTHKTIAGEDKAKQMLVEVYDGQRMVFQHYADNYDDVMTMTQSVSMPTQVLVNAARKKVGEARDRCEILLAANPKVLEGLSPPPKSEDNDSVDPNSSILDRWLASQNGGDFEAYSSLYSTDFGGVKNVSGTKKHYDRQGWLNDRKGMFNKSFTVTATDTKTDEKGDLEIVTFTQTWKSDSYEDVGIKELHIRDGRIVREEQLTSLEPLPGPSRSEWEAVGEVTVSGSSALKCETKILGGWFRAMCSGNEHGRPTAVSFVAGAEPEAVARMEGERIVLVHPYREGVSFAAKFSWGGTTWNLTVAWPEGAPRPSTTGRFN